MQILYITYDGLTDPLGQSQIIPYVSGLADTGYKTTILSCEKNEPFTQNHETIEKTLKKHGISWQYISYTKRPPILGTIWDLYKLKKAVNKLHIEKAFMVVHCRSYIASLIGLWLKNKFGIKFIFDMRGFYADERVDGKIWNTNNFLFNQVYRYFKKKEMEFLSFADYTISLTQNAKDIIHTWKQIPNQPIPIEVIPCCADLNQFSEESVDINEVTELKESLGISPEDFIISYLGSIGTWYMLPEMLDFFQQLLSVKPKAKFLFITQEPVGLIMDLAQQKNIASDRIIIQKANRNEVPSLVSLSQVNLFFILSVFSKKASSPTKMGEVMGMGIPIICNSGVGDVDAIINESKCGALVKNFNNGDYQKAINELDNLLLIPRKDIISAAKKYYSLEAGIEKYKKVYEHLT